MRSEIFVREQQSREYIERKKYYIEKKRNPQKNILFRPDILTHIEAQVIQKILVSRPYVINAWQKNQFVKLMKYIIIHKRMK